MSKHIILVVMYCSKHQHTTSTKFIFPHSFVVVIIVADFFFVVFIDSVINISINLDT